jgi:membrane-associated phospholipid phosphatase
VDAAAQASTDATAPLALGDAAPARRGLHKALVVGAPVVYVAALTIFVLSWGLPVAHDQLFLWVLLGLAAFSVSAWRSWGSMLLAWLPMLGLLVVYDYLRAAVSVAPAQAHVGTQIAIDKWLGGGVLPTVWLQRHLWDAAHLHWYDYAVWAVYMTHFFVVWLVAAALWRAARPRFARYAVLTVTLTLAAFLVYWTDPAQPPWLASESLSIAPVARTVPLVWEALGVSEMKSVYENGNLVNTVAAMPSLHGAYPFMLLLFFWRDGRLVRAGLAIYVLAMAFTLVYGGEHFVTDILAGWALAALVYALVALAWRAAARMPRPATSRSASPAAAQAASTATCPPAAAPSNSPVLRRRLPPAPGGMS